MDLPEPDGPMMETSSPLSMEKIYIVQNGNPAPPVHDGLGDACKSDHGQHPVSLAAYSRRVKVYVSDPLYSKWKHFAALACMRRL